MVLGAKAMKGYSVFLKAPALLEPHHQIVLVSYPGYSLEGGLTPLQPTGQYRVSLNKISDFTLKATMQFYVLFSFFI